MRNNQTGVTLIELLVTVVVVGILTSIALPSYRGYMMRVQRSEAKTELLQTSAALERCFSRFNSYTNVDCAAQTSLPRTLPSGRYTISASTLAAGNYTLSATPLVGQRDDLDCKTLTLDSSNTKGVTGGATRTADYCWSR